MKLGRSKDSYNWKLYIIIFQKWKSFEPPSSTLGEDRHIRSLTFCTKFNFEQLLFKAFFYAMRIFGGIEPQTESTFLTLGRDRHMSSQTFFVWNLISNNFYLKLFLMWCVFLAASSPKLNLLPRFCILLFFKNGNLSSPLAPLWGKIDICVRELFCTKLNSNNFHLKLFWMWCVFFWLRWAPNRIYFPILNIGTYSYVGPLALTIVVLPLYLHGLYYYCELWNSESLCNVEKTNK